MKRLSVILLCVVLFFTTSQAQVRITKQAGVKSALSMTGLDAGGAGAATVKQVLAADLQRSGWFDVRTGGPAAWTLTGQIREKRSGLQAECRIFGADNHRRWGQRFTGPHNEPRALAHEISDAIVRELTGRPGMASARIALVGLRSGNKELYLCDADGANLQQLTRDGSVSLYPAWSPDQRRIFYTSYLRRFPDILMIDLQSGQRKVITSYPGLNTGASVSPDGSLLALVLSKDGNPELYVRRLSDGQLTRLTRTGRAAEASPCWSPDGRRIAYVSDTTGSPQIYIVDRSGGAPERLPVRGFENVSPDWSAGGDLAYVSKAGGHYHVFITDPGGLRARQVSSGYADYEEPSWAPDGRHIVCKRTERHQSAIYILDTMGDAPVALLPQSGDWFSPAFSP